MPGAWAAAAGSGCASPAVAICVSNLLWICVIPPKLCIISRQALKPSAPLTYPFLSKTCLAAASIASDPWVMACPILPRWSRCFGFAASSLVPKSCSSAIA
eukprot:14500236-Heterocapsa_arctica.AAC.1